MTLSFYCSIRRPAPLNSLEQQALQKVVAKYSVASRIRRFEETGQGIRWRPLCLTKPEDFPAADTIFEVSAELPTETEDGLATAIDHWCNFATALRREIQKALWEVRIGDREVKHEWRSDRYDPAA
jgi:hypothetical protein